MAFSRRIPGETDAEWRNRRRRRSFQRDVIAITAAVIGLAIAAYAWWGVRDAQADNRRDLLATAQADLRSCQSENRTRPQIQVNVMVGIDGVLRLNPNITIGDRRRVASAYIDALKPELAPGRSIGFRNCDPREDDTIDRLDFLPGETPPDGWESGVPELIGTDGLPHVPEP